MVMTDGKNTNNVTQCTLTDLHTHILPGVDDGAECLEMSLEMLRKLKSVGVERVALTPHFYPMKEDLSAFVNRRGKAYDLLLSAWDEKTMPQLQLGTEVRYTPSLAELDLRRLTIGQGNYLLLELPDMGASTFVEQVADTILQQGITPILAHVERCVSLREDPDRLLRLAQMGTLAQISTGALTRRVDSFAVACLQNGLAQFVASDAHNLSGRFCFFDAAATKKYAEIIRRTEEFARSVWENTPLPAFSIQPVKKGFLGYH